MLNHFIDSVEKMLMSPASPVTINPSPVLKRSNAGKAIKRCRAAWQHAFDASTAAAAKIGAVSWAEQDAAKAYRNAMPVLSGYESIRDYIACVAHGILIGAIPADRSGQLLYAAQVAISSLSHQPTPHKASPTLPPHPPSRKKPAANSHSRIITSIESIDS